MLQTIQGDTGNVPMHMPTTRPLIPAEHEMSVFHVMAETAVSSKMYKGIGEKAGVMMIMLSARELGISPMQALNGGLNIINGKVEISARMMNALIRRSGHKIVVQEFTEKRCMITGQRCDTGEQQSAVFTIEEAQKAGLVKPGGGWTKWPKDMLFARALSRLARQLFSDVIGIGYVEGEIQASDAQIIMPEQIQETEIVEDESEYVEKYIQIFEKDDKFLAMEYMKMVKEHFNWSTIETIKEFFKDQKKMFEKFESWKSKRKVTDGS